MEKIKLNEFGDVFRGIHRTHSKLKSKGKYLYLTGRNIQEGNIVSHKKDKFLDVDNDDKRILRLGDILVTALWNKRKVYQYKMSDPLSIISGNQIIIRSPEYEYLSKYFQIEEFYNQFELDCQNRLTGSVIPFLSLKNFKEIEILKISESELLEKLEKEALPKIEKENLLRSIQTNKLEDIQKYFLEDLINSHFKNEIVKLSQQHESVHLEFKSSFRTDIEYGGKISRDKMINNIIKGIGGFCNTGGGDLLIGVSDHNEIIGIEVDGYDNTDHFLRSLHQHISNQTLPDVSKIPDCLSITTFTTKKNKTICRINVSPCFEDIFVKHKGDETFYFRNGPQTTPLTGSALVKYCRDKKETWD